MHASVVVKKLHKKFLGDDGSGQLVGWRGKTAEYLNLKKALGKCVVDLCLFDSDSIITMITPWSFDRLILRVLSENQPNDVLHLNSEQKTERKNRARG